PNKQPARRRAAALERAGQSRNNPSHRSETGHYPGLDGLSIGDLAAEVGMSKSGLYAHFKSKEELELATIETAAAVFDREVLRPAAMARAGIERLKTLAGSFLSHLERKVFPGGCFFAAVAPAPGPRPPPPPPPPPP